jgi:hypothetical protein
MEIVASSSSTEFYGWQFFVKRKTVEQKTKFPYSQGVISWNL